ncbi:MAG: DoxX family protein [Rhodothermaceae bacterium]|nr:DoxX family protein [Rhodothermaceae bacterium]
MQLRDRHLHQRIRKVLLVLFALYFTIMFVKNGYLKFDPEGFWGPAFERWGYPVWFLFFIGVLEFGGGLAILVPRIAPYGALVLAVVMLGALVTRLIHGVSFGDASSITFNMVAMLLLAYEHEPIKSLVYKKESSADSQLERGRIEESIR